MKKRIRLLQYTRPNRDSVPCWWSRVMFHADKQREARELRGPVCPTATHVSPPGSPLNSWYFTRHPAPACVRRFPIFDFLSSHLCGEVPREVVAGYDTRQNRTTIHLCEKDRRLLGFQSHQSCRLQVVEGHRWEIDFWSSLSLNNNSALLINRSQLKPQVLQGNNTCLQIRLQ